MKSQSAIPTLGDATENLCSGKKTQSSEHIKSLHAYCAARLVLEGGFPPEWVKPRPSLSSRRISNALHQLSLTPEARDTAEQRVLGGFKRKNIDVTIDVPGLGPALGISAKSTGNAFRNLTNRMEEAPGDSTNIHLMYPGFVFGFLHLIRFSKQSEVEDPQDASFDKHNDPLPSIVRYHAALAALAGRTAITDPVMRYEAIGLLIYRCRVSKSEIWGGYPPTDSPLHFSRFFQRLYDNYDLRYSYPDPDGPYIRKEWQTQKLLRSLTQVY